MESGNLEGGRAARQARNPFWGVNIDWGKGIMFNIRYRPVRQFVEINQQHIVACHGDMLLSMVDCVNGGPEELLPLSGVVAIIMTLCNASLTCER